MTSRINRRLVLGGLAALPACRASGSKFEADIIVLGAGLAGLNAARLLSAEGKDVLVLEGSSRIGGRVHTLDHGTLGLTEGGGAKIQPSDSRMIDMARQLKLDLLPDRSAPQATHYFYQGQNYTSDSLKGAKPFSFPPPFGGSAPSEALMALANKNNPLTSLEDWRDPGFEAYDIAAQVFLSQAGFKGDAQKVIEQALNGNSLRNYSMMNLYRELILGTQSRGSDPSLSVKGGAQRLPEAMADSLPRKVKLNQIVQTISVETDKVIIETAGGKTYRAAQCICALPFAAMRSISLKAFMPEAQSDAIRDLPYTQVLQIHLKAKTRFWEQDGLPANMWTDLPMEQLIAERDRGGEPTGIFRAIINGRSATRSIWEDRSKIAERVSAYMKTVRPASEGQFDVLSVQDWTKSNPMAGGAYMHWAPGQIGQWAEEMSAPSSRLAFAGEHLSRLQTGMEGAMESGEEAASYILNSKD